MRDADEDADTTAEVVDETVALLGTMDFTEYEARCFVALSRIGKGTAKEVSEVADVPRARIYDSMDALQAAGLVDVQESKPKRFRAVDSDQAASLLDRRYRERIERLEDLLAGLRAPDREGESGEVWVLDGRESVSERLARLLAGATDEVLLAIATEDLLTETVEQRIVEAAQRGVLVTIGSPSEAIRDRLRAQVPDATVVETWTWWESHPIEPGAVSCILMVDGERLLASADTETSLPDVRHYRAVWTDGHAAPLVGMLRPLLAAAITGE